MPVRGEYREPVAGFHPELISHGVGQPQQPVGVDGERSFVTHPLARQVDERDLVGQSFDDRQQEPGIHQLLHDNPPVSTVRQTGSIPPRSRRAGSEPASPTKATVASAAEAGILAMAVIITLGRAKPTASIVTGSTGTAAGRRPGSLP